MKYSIKTLVAVTMLFSATLSANAQFDNNRETARFHFGIRGGVSANSWRGDIGDNVDPLWFPTGGFAFDFQVAPVPVFIGFGVNYLNEGYKYTSSWGGSKTQNASALHIPLVVGYHFNVSPNFFISPYVGGFTSYCLEDLDSDADWSDDRFNYGLRFGVGLNFGRLTFDLAYDLGLKNSGGKYYIWDKDYTTPRIVKFDAFTGTFFATIGFNIAGKR